MRLYRPVRLLIMKRVVNHTRAESYGTGILQHRAIIETLPAEMRE